MRTLLDVRSEIACIMSAYDDGMTKHELSRAKTRICFLRLIEKYLENSPEELFINREIKRLENRINLIYDTFDESDYKDPREARKKFEKEMGIPHLRLQLKALRFIKK